MKLEPIDVIGFSAGGFIAAEMAAADPAIFSHMVLVAPMGIKPATGEIFDFFAVTVRRHLMATVADPANTPEYLKIYGGQMTPDRFEAFEDARSETARIGWEPFMHNPSLPHLLRGAKTPTLLVWGTQRQSRAARLYRRLSRCDRGRPGRRNRRRRPSSRNRKRRGVRSRGQEIPVRVATNNREVSEMQIGYFTERPYRWLPEEEILRNRGYFAVSNGHFDREKAADDYHYYLDEYCYAEDLRFRRRRAQ